MTLPAPTNIMLYMSAENELSANALQNIEDIKACCPLDGISTYIMLDQMKNTSDMKTIIYRLPPGATQEQFQAFDTHQNKEASSPFVFNNHLSLARMHFALTPPPPPRQKILFLWGHGNGLVMLDEEQEQGMGRAQASIREFAKVLAKKAADNATEEFDIIAFDACYMAVIETMHELRETTKFVLCSSTAVAAESFPYQTIYKALIKDDHSSSPKVAAELIARLIARLYGEHYLAEYEDGSRFLFVCRMDKIGRTMTCLNELGSLLADLIVHDSPDGTLHSALTRVLVRAGAEADYLYVLDLLDSLQSVLRNILPAPTFQNVQKLCENLREAAIEAFEMTQGNMNSVSVSPKVWAPLHIGVYLTMAPFYNELESSDHGNAGWARLWKCYHNPMIPAITPDLEGIKDVLGLPSVAQSGR
jgi:Clostripain family